MHRAEMPEDRIFLHENIHFEIYPQDPAVRFISIRSPQD
jgi:hypothetical protein